VSAGFELAVAVFVDKSVEVVVKQVVTAFFVYTAVAVVVNAVTSLLNAVNALHEACNICGYTSAATKIEECLKQ